MKNVMNFKVLISCTVVLVSGITYAGEIFKCTNEKSEVYYNDKPCPVNDIEKKMQAVKDPKNPYYHEVDNIKKDEFTKLNASSATKQSQEGLKQEELTSESKSKNTSQSSSGVNSSINESTKTTSKASKKLSYQPKKTTQNTEIVYDTRSTTKKVVDNEN